jgi:hypothetical protein
MTYTSTIRNYKAITINDYSGAFVNSDSVHCPIKFVVIDSDGSSEISGGTSSDGTIIFNRDATNGIFD